MAIINGTAGDDFIGGTMGDDQISTFGGNDLVNAGGGNDSVDGGDDHDNLRGEDGNDSLLGGNGDDYLRGGPGNDLLDGGAGWDRVAYVTATSGVTVDLNIQGVAQNTGVGFDTLIGIEHASGTPYADSLTGNAGDNWLWGEGGDDVFDGGNGNDLIEAGTGTVTADGGLGVDSFSIWNNGEAYGGAITLSLLLQGGAQSTGAGSMTLSGFENLSGSAVSDTLIGDGGANVLTGDEGNDTLSGGDGDDTLYGDGRIIVDTHGVGTSGPITTYADAAAAFGLPSGDDVLDGGLGNDVLNGGGGSDTASYASATGAVHVFFNNAGGGVASGAAGNDTLISIENVIGSPFDDQILGDAGANVLEGGDGHDYLRAKGGADSLIGGNGDDYLGGGFGDDVVNGGAGWDRAAFFHDAIAGVTVDLNIQGVAQDTGQGQDILIGIEHASGTSFADTLIGNGGDNWLWGEGGNDIFSAGGGNDLVEVGPGDVTADGGAGTDTFSAWNNGGPLASGIVLSLTLQGAAQSTALGQMTLSGFENLSGTSYADALTGDGGANDLAGDEGNDTLSGGDGNDTLYGDGRIIADTHGVGTSGPITTFGDVAAAFGLSSGDDVLDGGLGDDVLNGGGGSDTASYASASGAVDVFLTNSGGGGASGAAGNDSFVSIENVTGSGFADNITGNDAANVLAGGAGHDFMRGNGGNDAMSGGDGDDYLAGGDGDDTLDGGTGIDRASYYAGATAGVTVNLGLAGPQATGRGSDTLISIEQVTGTAFADVITGTGGDNWLLVLDGNDSVSAGAGNDLVGDSGGNDTLDGGLGTDTLSLDDFGLSGFSTGFTVSLALQGAAQNSGHGMKTLSGFENLSGSAFADVLTGDAAANILGGALGNDTLSGGDGNDILYGDGQFSTARTVAGGGAVTLYADAAASFDGAAGNDVLDGGKGNDILVGGGGNDVMTGGAGNDVFVVGAGSGQDRVTDFDKKDLIAIVGVAGVDDFSDLTIVNDATGKNAVVSWGTGDSITIDGMKASKVTASMFSFSDPTAAASAALMAGDAYHPSSHGGGMIAPHELLF